MTNPKRTCSIEGCEKPSNCRTWCQMHYKRWVQHGDPQGGGPLRSAPLIDRFMHYVDRTETCWLWTGGLFATGYASFNLDRRSVHGHRWLYEHLVGAVPDGLELDHLCRVRACVNPAHLEAVTHAENIRRSPTAPPAVNARKTHCIHGHEFTPENTYVWHGHRWCRRCRDRNDEER